MLSVIAHGVFVSTIYSTTQMASEMKHSSVLPPPAYSSSTVNLNPAPPASEMWQIQKDDVTVRWMTHLNVICIQWESQLVETVFHQKPEFQQKQSEQRREIKLMPR